MVAGGVASAGVVKLGVGSVRSDGALWLAETWFAETVSHVVP